MMSNQMLAVDHLSVYYRKVEALRNINFSLPSGQLIGILGPNGAGKSTLIKAMLGLIPTVRGNVYYREQLLSHQLEHTAYVPQRSQIDWTFPATVWDVVMMGRVTKTGWFNRFSANSRRIAQESLERVGMSTYINRPIGALSGGQQQRVFLARALSQQADIFFLDEPFVGVDQKTETILFKIFKELTEEGKTIMVVNHDLGESITHFDQLLLLNRELVAVGERNKVLTAQNLQRAYGGYVQFFDQAA